MNFDLKYEKTIFDSDIILTSLKRLILSTSETFKERNIEDRVLLFLTFFRSLKDFDFLAKC